jgi:hypothetical protein
MKIVDCIQEFASIFGGFTRFSSLSHFTFIFKEE